MPQDNLFINIQKYSPGEGPNPKENFLTEAFAHLLRRVPGVLASVFAPLLLEFDLEDAVIRTQKRYSLGQIDLEMELKDSRRILIENKLEADIHWALDESGENVPQLDNYLTIADTSNGLVLLVSRDDIPLEDKVLHHPRFLGQLPWFEIWKNLSRFLETHLRSVDETHVQRYLLTQFLEFMESENMDPLKAITEKDRLMLEEYWEFRRNLRKFLDRIKSSISERFDIEFDSGRHEGTEFYYTVFRIDDIECKLFLYYDSENLVTPMFYVGVGIEDQMGMDLSEYDYTREGEYFWIEHEPSEDFYEKDAETQIQEVTGFFVNSLGALQKLGLIEDRK